MMEEILDEVVSSEDLKVSHECISQVYLRLFYIFIFTSPCLNFSMSSFYVLRYLWNVSQKADL